MSKRSNTENNAKSIDPAIEALANQLSSLPNSESDALWVADEHPLPQSSFRLLADSKSRFLSNRFDQHQRACQQGIPSWFSDFNFSEAADTPFQHIFFRTAKERPIVHRVINQARSILPIGGSLWLSGFKQEGIRRHIQRAEECFGTTARISRHKGQLFVAELVQQSAGTGALNDENYPSLREISSDGFSFYSKPGLYGWNKVDVASKYLTDWLEQNTDGFSGERVLDLGCGYGYLSMRGLELGAQEVVATDNCAAALVASQKNLEVSGSKFSVVASDAGKEVDGSFSIILCNPPFHQGFSTTPELHQRFIREAKRLLAPNGNAWFVVNQFLNLGDIAEKEGLTFLELDKTQSFKIVQLNQF